MSTLWIDEYSGVGTDSAPSAQIPRVPPIVRQKLTYTTAVQSAVFNDVTRYIGVYADNGDDVSFLDFGDNPTATDATTPLEDGYTRFFAVKKGHRLSVYDGVST